MNYQRTYTRHQTAAKPKVVIQHYQEKLQKRLCCAGRSENVTLNIPEVTCKNCLGKLKETARQKHNGTIDWEAIQSALSKKLPEIKKAIIEFTFEHNNWLKADYILKSFPPRISLTFWLPQMISNKCRKSVGINSPLSPLTEPDVIQVYIPTEEEMNIVASFVEQLADSHKLRPYREDRESACLSYVLKPEYK